MKIVGIATRARITDYSLSYSFCTDSLMDTMASSHFNFTHIISFMLYMLSVFTYTRIDIRSTKK